MSFSSQVKTEIASIENYSACCSKAQVYGLVLFAHFSLSEVSITTENPAVLEAYVNAVESICGSKPSISTNATKKVDACVDSRELRTKIFDYFSHTSGAATTRINRANITQDCCYAAFLRGAFLACGTVTDPKKNYHLEFVISHKKLCLDMMKLMEELELRPKYILRKGNHIIYFKDSESIEDVLTVIGASNAALEIMGIKIEKDVKNSVNRKLNFEMSNLSKTVNASSVQIDAIEKILSKHSISWLPANLREIAVLRMENPDVTLKELGSLLSEPISRSGVNHRLTRLIEIAESIEE